MADYVMGMMDNNPVNRWRQGQISKRNKIIIILCAIVSLIALISVIILKTASCNVNDDTPTNQVPTKTESTLSKDLKNSSCLSHACIDSASKILKFMNATVDPCEDFYRFSCGNFLEITKIPKEKKQLNNMDIIQEKVQEQIKTMLEEPIDPKEPKHFGLLKTLYQSCIDRATIEERGVQTALELFKRVGGWPVLEGNSWNDEHFVWQDLIRNLKKEGLVVHSLFTTTVKRKGNSTEELLSIDRPSNKILKLLMKGINNKDVKDYYNSMVNTAVAFGANRTYAEAELNNTLVFEMQIANISTKNERRPSPPTTMTVKELHQNFPSIPWTNYFNKLLSRNILKDVVVKVNHLSFFQGLETIIHKTPNRILANHIMWKVVEKIAIFLNDDVRGKQPTPRWKDCTDFLRKEMGYSFDALYINKYFHQDSKKIITDIFDDSRKGFEGLLKQADWMDNNAKDAAIEKLWAMSAFVGHADEHLDNNFIDEHYANLTITPGDYLQAFLNLSRFEPKTSLPLVNSPLIINTKYSPVHNNLDLHASTLQEGFFNYNRPKYINYGTTAFFIGHEIIHGFDEHGSIFNKEGFHHDWWGAKTKENFAEKTKCFISQYRNYIEKEANLSLTSTKTQNENIPDSEGIKLAYLAYREWEKRNGPELLLPGLNYTAPQIFWISAAQAWCTKYTPEGMKNTISSSNSPADYRIMGSFSNSPEFAKDFKCPEKSKMNPKHKCSIW